MRRMGCKQRRSNRRSQQPRAQRLEQEEEQPCGEAVQHGTHQVKGPGRQPRRLVGQHPREPRHGPEVAHLNVAAPLGGAREEVGHKEPRPALGRAQRLGASDEQMVILGEAMLARRQVEERGKDRDQQRSERRPVPPLGSLPASVRRLQRHD